MSRLAREAASRKEREDAAARERKKKEDKVNAIRQKQELFSRNKRENAEKKRLEEVAPHTYKFLVERNDKLPTLAHKLLITAEGRTIKQLLLSVGLRAFMRPEALEAGACFPGSALGAVLDSTTDGAGKGCQVRALKLDGYQQNKYSVQQFEIVRPGENYQDGDRVFISNPNHASSAGVASRIPDAEDASFIARVDPPHVQCVVDQRLAIDQGAKNEIESLVL